MAKNLSFEYAKSANNKIVMQIKEFKNKKYLDIREQFRNEDEWLFTKKGASIPISEAKTLLADLEELIRNTPE